MPEMLLELDNWEHGPKWLQNIESEWPASPVDVLNDIPDRVSPGKTSYVITLEPEFDIIERYSKL